MIIRRDFQPANEDLAAGVITGHDSIEEHFMIAQG